MPVPQHYNGEVAQKAIIEKEGKVLVVRAPGESEYDLPGGRLNVDEHPTAALAREVTEELGVQIDVGAPVFADVWYNPQGTPRYFVAFGSKLKDLNSEFVLQKEEIAEARWIGKDELDTVPLYEICRNALKAYFADQ